MREISQQDLSFTELEVCELKTGRDGATHQRIAPWLTNRCRMAAKPGAARYNVLQTLPAQHVAAQHCSRDCILR